MNREYAEKVEILLRLLPVVMDEKVFAVHGGSAINLFIKNLPRYSVDIDLTYIPLEGRDESLEHIWELKKWIPDPCNPYLHYLKPDDTDGQRVARSPRQLNPRS